MDICVLGAGTWGMPLAALLSKNGHNVTVWSALEKEIEYLREHHANPNLEGVIFPEDIYYTTDIEEAVSEKEVVLFVVASQFYRATAAKAAPYVKSGAKIISASKGIEPGTLMTMTDIIDDEMKKNAPDTKYSNVALSGPTHAEEVARGIPTSIVSACEDEAVALEVAEIFKNSCLRVYTNPDIRGVELCGAMKNIMALACGILTGMGYGDNTRAMLMTRGIAEMTRIGLAMGCKRRTFMGLAGIGDLIVTCTSQHSRNNRCGYLIGTGMSYEEASKQIGMVVEGYHALEAAMELSAEYGVEMPITAAVNDVVKNGRNIDEVAFDLMTRDIKNELDT